MASANASQPTMFISTDALLEHWQGHRRLTRRVIEMFPDDQLFAFSIGGMRTFGDLANELLSMAGPMAHGLATLEWGGYAPPKATSKAEILRLWDEGTTRVNEFWAQIPAGRFQETLTSFGQYTGFGYWQVLYIVDNEVHHAGRATSTSARWVSSRRRSGSADYSCRFSTGGSS